MPSSKNTLLLAAGTLGLATWLSYRAESHVMDAAGSKPVTIQSVVRRVMAPRSRTEHIDRLNEIRHAAGRTSLTHREATECWQIIRGFTVEDVKAFLAEIPQTPLRPANDALIGMLFYRWAQIDPEAAAREAIQPAYQGVSGTPLISVATAWADRDPEAALHWAASTDSRAARYLVGHAAGKMLALQDPEGAVSKAATEFPEAMNGVISALVRDSRNSEEIRRQTLSQLTGLSDPKALDLYLNQLLWSGVQNDPESRRSLLDEIERSGVPSEKLVSFRTRLEDYTKSDDPRGTMEAMQQPGSEGSDSQQKSHYAFWAANHPDDAASWAVQAGRTDLIADTVKNKAAGLLHSSWQPEAANSSSPWVKGILTQYDSWRKLDAGAAEAWLQTMPADIRNHLSQDNAAH